MGEKKGGEGRGRQQLSDEINSAKALVLGLSIHLALKRKADEGTCEKVQENKFACIQRKQTQSKNVT